MVNDGVRRLVAAALVVAIAGLAGTDGLLPDVRTYWAEHALTGSLLSSLLAVAVTGLIVDELVARRQRRARSVSVAAQALIVYTQARHLRDSVVAGVESGDRSDSDADLRSFANMLLVASSTFFDDPVARAFVIEAERFAESSIEVISARDDRTHATSAHERLEAPMARLQLVVEPLARRLPRTAASQ
jgi:hypothetical protein